MKTALALFFALAASLFAQTQTNRFGIEFEYPASEVTNVVLSIQRTPSFDTNGFWSDVIVFRVIFIEPDGPYAFYRVGAEPIAEAEEAKANKPTDFGSKRGKH